MFTLMASNIVAGIFRRSDKIYFAKLTEQIKVFLIQLQLIISHDNTENACGILETV